jgi:hypothetical protein
MNISIYTPGPTTNTVRRADGEILKAPKDWSLLPPGDATLTRRVKAEGEFWAVQEKKGKRIVSRGVWAPTLTIARIGEQLNAHRSSAEYATQKKAQLRRREKKQALYVIEFRESVRLFLNFHPTHIKLADQIAKLVTDHATPIGSRTVARTSRIPVEKRAEAAVIAWMRHQTTGYDKMVLPRVKGRRREVRRLLAQRSKELLQRYRQNASIPHDCPLLACVLTH